MKNEAPLPLTRLLHSIQGHLALPEPAELYQVSLLSSLAVGLLRGQVSYGEISRHGDFGLGTFDFLDGEMVALDGEFFQVRSDGSAIPVDPTAKAPFAMVTFFQPQKRISLPDPHRRSELEARLGTELQKNLFNAVRLEGDFAFVHTRTVQKQPAEKTKLLAAAAGQAERYFEHVRGTMVGFRSPAYLAGVALPSLHLHFLRADRKAGGHVMDFTLSSGNAWVQVLNEYHIELPVTSEFTHADLESPDIQKEIESAEG